MITIQLNDYELQVAIYNIACNYEGFEIRENVRQGYWEQARNGCKQGLEQAISDYLLLQNDFDPQDGKYKRLSEDALRGKMIDYKL